MQLDRGFASGFIFAAIRSRSRGICRGFSLAWESSRVSPWELEWELEWVWLPKTVGIVKQTAKSAVSRRGGRAVGIEKPTVFDRGFLVGIENSHGQTHGTRVL